MKSSILTIAIACLITNVLYSQSPNTATPMSEDKKIATQMVLAATSVPYMIDLLWQAPLGSRLGWVTASAHNPSQREARANVFLLRGTGTMFSPGFGDICTRLRRDGVWAEDLGSAGESWIVKHLIEERKAGRLKGPIIMVGHSRGGRHILDAAHELQKSGFIVDLLVCLDVAAPTTVPSNVRKALNLYMTQHRIYPAEKLKPTIGSQTIIENVDLNAPSSPVKIHELNHINITNDTGVQNYVINAIEKVVNQRP
ncbi:MAG TPA: hypothetical protein PLN21_01675 [Gemmatales bacterium]|nr:hypothetical protein [Gemmatales bacterium]